MSASKVVTLKRIVAAIEDLNANIGWDKPIKIGAKDSEEKLTKKIQKKQDCKEDCLIEADYDPQETIGHTIKHETVVTLVDLGIKGLPKKWPQVAANEPEEVEEVEEPKTNKKTKAKGKDTKASKPKAKASSGDKKPKVGVIGTIVSILIKAKEIKKDDLLDQLEKAFPEKQRKSMSNTITAQLSRMKKERGIHAKYDRGTGVITVEKIEKA